MRELLILCVPALVLAILGCCWRALDLLVSRRPAAAWLWSSDYSEAEQWDDRWGVGALRGWHPLADGENGRMIDEVVHFEDDAGCRHVAQLRRRVWRGRRPETAHIVWYDPRQPDRVTAFGPGHWLLNALLLLGALASVLNAGTHLRG